MEPTVQTIDRRELIKRATLLGGAFAVRNSALNVLTAAASTGRTAARGASMLIERGDGPYGPLAATPNADALFLPAGFTSRVVAISGQPVVGVPDTSLAATSYVWHDFPDGAATFPTPMGGWIYVSNSENPEPLGGVGALRFAPDATILGGYRILDGTGGNCSGGPTPWGTWLSCEEADGGHVWECDPTAPGQGVERPGLGTFTHEAAAVDPIGKAVYLTEDEGDSRLYRFVPERYPDLSAGQLEAAIVDAKGRVTWQETSKDGPDRSANTASFRRGEGMFYDRGRVFFTTTSDDRVWMLDTAKQRLEVFYDGEVLGGPLSDPDNVTVHAQSGDVFVAEDAGDLELCVLASSDPTRRSAVVAPFVRIDGDSTSEVASEVSGPAFNPAGNRLYFSSQRGGPVGALNHSGFGITYEVTGPFRRAA